MTAAPFDPLLSVFPCATDADTVSDLPLSAIISRIRSPELAGTTVRIAAAFAAAGGGKAGKQAIDTAKKRLPAVTLAGAFTRRANDAWAEPSGLVQFDLDELTPSEKAAARVVLSACPWVACLWASPSGAGLKGAVRMPGLTLPEPMRYTEAWRAVTRWLESVGLVNDPAAKDCSRLAYLANDPTAWHNPQAEPFDCEPWAEPVPAPAPILPSSSVRGYIPAADVERRALAYVRAMPASIAGDNGSAAMVAVVRTLHDGFALSGAELWRVVDAWNAERATPPWSHAEMQRGLASVEHVPPQHPRGWLLHAPMPAAHGMIVRPAESSASHTFASERLLAERLAASPLRLLMRYVPSGPDGGWRKWSGDCWAECLDQVPNVFSAAVHLELSALFSANLIDQRVARQMETTGAMRGVRSQVSAYASIQLDPGSLDPPGMVPTVGGLLDLERGGVVSASDPSTSRFLRCAGVGYDPAARHDLWDEVAAHIAVIPGGHVVQRFLGASLLGVPPDRKALFLVGDGGDGKSTLLRSCALAMGGFARVVPAEALAGEGRGAHGHELLSGLAVARLAIATEVRATLDWALFKALTGGDPRTTKRMHSRSIEVQPKGWLALATNEPPRPPDAASRDRCILVRWAKPADPNPAIVVLLATPGPERNAFLRACLRWMVEGCRMYQRDGLGVPDFAKAEVEPEGLAAWYNERVEAGTFLPGKGWIGYEELASDARAWHSSQGNQPPSDREVGCFLRGRLATRRHGPSKKRQYHVAVHDGT